MKRLLIIGAGGFGREMATAAREAAGFGVDFSLGGFLDDNPGALDGFANYPPVVGGIDSYVPGKDDVFVSAIGDTEVRRKCVEKLAARGAEFIPVIHRTASVGTNVRIGRGSFIANNVVLTADVTVGEHACVFHNSSIGHDTVLGDFSHVYAVCSLGGSVRVGAGARIYPGSVVLPRRKIGERAVVGAGSTVVVDVDAGSTVFGSPAKPLE
ncbi:MAG: acetyltransferase [Kiritimatiellae bacterium]|nr:acetyltransferase [Kiritimatiellia bacterium]